MRLSNSLIASLDFMFRTSTVYGQSINSRVVSFTDNNIFNISLVVPIQTNCNIFIPLIATNSIHSKDITETIIFPLYINGNVQKRTSDAILKTVFCANERRLVKISTPKGDVFYSGKGVLLDSAFNPLMIWGYKTFIEDKKEGLLRYNTTPIGYQCYISPRVFTNEDLVSKAIIKKVIPYISSEVIYSYGNSTFNRISGSVVITIQDIDYMIVRPETPVNFDTIDDDIWSAIRDNINNIN